MARRLRALAFMGHSTAALAGRMGVPGRVVRRLQRGAPREVPAALAAQVAALYDDLWDVSGGSASSAREAQRKNWCPPLGWDEDQPGDDGYAGHGIDDPDAGPAPGWQRPRHRRRLSADEQAADLAELVRLGLSVSQAALRLGLSGDALRRIREHAARGVMTARVIPFPAVPVAGPLTGELRPGGEYADIARACRDLPGAGQDGAP